MHIPNSFFDLKKILSDFLDVIIFLNLIMWLKISMY